MNKTKIIFLVTTLLIVVMEGLLPAFTSQTDMAKEGIRHLGYPEYFGSMLAVFKVVGALVLILPKAPTRIKEWAYAGFGIDFLCAFISILVVDGLVGLALVPFVFMVILVLSYRSYRKLRFAKTSQPV